jgi:hypothetical protein
MATRSTIAVQLADGQVRQVYCHWDGYLGWNGQLLEQHYNTQEAAEAITELGDISALRKQITPTGDAHTFDTPEENTTIFYGRDRGESRTEPRVFADMKDYVANCQREEYDYVFVEGVWYVRCDASGKKRVTIEQAYRLEKTKYAGE